jgi:hypothetical protein
MNQLPSSIMKTITRALGAAILVSLVAAFSHAEAPQATLQVVVKNEQGAPTANAPVYVAGEHTNHFATTDANGSLSINLPEGTYTVSSAMSINNDGVVDRFASPEAKVEVGAGDLTSVVLCLTALPDAVASIELSTLRKIGVDTELAKNLN